MLRWRYRSLVKEGTHCHLLTLEEIWKHHLISESWQKASASTEIDFSATSFNLNTVQYCRKNTVSFRALRMDREQVKKSLLVFGKKWCLSNRQVWKTLIYVINMLNLNHLVEKIPIKIRLYNSSSKKAYLGGQLFLLCSKFNHNEQGEVN